MTREFFGDMSGLAQAVRQRSDRAMERMMTDPWAAEMHPEKVKSAESGIYSSQVNDSYRIIWKYIKPNGVVFCLIDQHDKAYQRASRKSFTLENGIVRIADITEVGATTQAGHEDLFGTAMKAGKNIGALFIGYRDSEILAWGVPEEVLPNIRALDNANQLDLVERLVSARVFDTLIAKALDIVERPVVADSSLSQSLAENQGGDDLYRFVDSDEFKRVLNGTLEEWMLFLAPPQRALILRSFNGPARVKGVAGSGKTVIALHRARQLAKKAQQDHGKLLFLTFGNRLPNVNKHLLSQLIGDDSDLLSTIECSTIHHWCARFLHTCSHTLVVNDEKSKTLLENAIMTCKKDLGKQSPLGNRDVNFYADEIRYMIKGRDIRAESDYLSLERSGRGTRLNAEERKVVWKVFTLYQQKMQADHICDFDDFILYALDHIRASELKQKYQFAIVDEIQDLTEATMKLIREIVVPGPDDLFLVGDGLQRIYPGGYNLSRLGIDITGRGTILRRNYRNTQQILQAAHAMMGDLTYDDMDEELTEPQIPEYSVRQGPIPEIHSFLDPEHEMNWIIQEIQKLMVINKYQEKDFAIIHRWSNPYERFIDQIIGEKYKVVELGKDEMTYFGPGVKRSTFHSAKGLEFKVVFVVGLTDGVLVPKDDWYLKDDALDEYMLRERRLLYVAMSRARDILYLSCARGQPSRFLNGIPHQMLLQEN
jgi:superfamily I DNA/RNA helicase/Txe/YoeB family toxin of Txe-Axe toxin-antitoxin module